MGKIFGQIGFQIFRIFFNKFFLGTSSRVLMSLSNNTYHILSLPFLIILSFSYHISIILFVLLLIHDTTLPRCIARQSSREEEEEEEVFEEEEEVFEEEEEGEEVFRPFLRQRQPCHQICYSS